MLFSQKPKDATSATEQKNEKAKKAKTVAPKNKSVITVGKKKYAVGILWQPFRSLSAKNAEIKEASKFNKTNLFCVKNKGIPQYGLASTKEGYSSGMATGAGAVANVLSDKSSSVSMFKVNIGWWMVVIRNDLILPEEDKIFTDEEEAKKAFTAMLTVPDWGYRICPESWQVPDSKEIPIEQLLTGKIPNITLQNLDNTMTHLIIFAVIAGIAGVGFKIIMDKKKQQEAELQRQLEEARRIQMEQERKKKEEEQRLANMPVPPAWEKIIDPKKFTEVCIEHVRRNFQIFAGWGLKSITCEQTGVKVEWVRGDMGKNDWLEEKAKIEGYIPPEMTFEEITATKATGIIKYSEKELQQIRGEPFIKMADLKNKLADWFENYGMQNRKTTESSKTVNLPEANKSESFPYLKFYFENKRNPIDVMNLLKSFSGLEFTSIKCDNVNDIEIKWTYEGIVYAKK